MAIPNAANPIIKCPLSKATVAIAADVNPIKPLRPSQSILPNKSIKLAVKSTTTLSAFEMPSITF